MNKILRFSFVAFLAMMVGNVMADDVTDELTRSTFGISSNNYSSVSDITSTSSAVYAANMAGGNDAIQLRSKNSNSGIVTTTSGGKVKSITIEWNSNTLDARVLKVYGSSTAYSDPTDLYGDNKGDEIASFTKSDGTKTETITGDYQYIGFRSNADAMYIDKITVVWEAGGQSQTKTATTIEFSGDYLTKFTQGKDGNKADLPTAIVKAGDAAVEGATVTWSLTKGSNWSADSDPVINGTKIEFGDHSCGDLTVKASYEGNDNYKASNKTYTLKVYKGYMAIKSILEDYPVVGSDSWKGKEAEWKAGTQISYWQVEAISQEEFTSKEALVTYVNGQYTYIKDNDGCLLLYGSNLGFKQGDKISGDLGDNKIGAIYGTLKTYSGLLELATTKDDIEFVVKSSDNAVEPKTITIDQLTQDNMNEYLKIDNAEYVSADGKNISFKVGETELAVYNQFNINIEALVAGAKYTLTGMGTIYYKNETLTNQLYLVDFTKTSDSSANVNTINAMKKNGAIYNLAGQRVQTMSRGLYIINGKKVIMK